MGGLNEESDELLCVGGRERENDVEVGWLYNGNKDTRTRCYVYVICMQVCCGCRSNCSGISSIKCTFFISLHVLFALL